MKILGLDLGARRIGVAIAEDGVIGSLDTIVYDSREESIGKIMEICRKENISKIVLGMPLGKQESEDVVRSFAMELTKFIGLPIEYEDETLTSKEAERLLLNQKIDPRSKDYKAEVDRISAKLILEQHLKKS